jgi:hypothetical protein
MKKLIDTISKYAAGGAIFATLHVYNDRFHTVNNNIINKKLENMEAKLDELKTKLVEDQIREETSRVFNCEKFSDNLNTKITQVQADFETANKLASKSEESQTITDHLNSANKHLNEANDLINNFVSDLINKTSSSGSNFISYYFNSYNDYISNLNTEQLGALAHILASIFILFCLFSIISVFYGDKLLIYLKLEERFPKLAKFIKLRRIFQHYYFLLNTILIIITLIYVIYVNYNAFFYYTQF